MTLVITANIFFILMVEHSQWSPWREKNKHQCRRHWKLENLGSRERTERGRAQVSWELSRSWEPEFCWQYGCWLPSDSWTLAGGGKRKCHWPEGSWKGITAARHSCPPFIFIWPSTSRDVILACASQSLREERSSKEEKAATRNLEKQPI